MPNRINISSAVHNRVKDFFTVESRGRVVTKDKDLEMYFVNGILPGLQGDGGDTIPPAAFAQRYRTYFEKDPPAFPEFLLARHESRQRVAGRGSL
jgi:hypothetical protein